MPSIWPWPRMSTLQQRLWLNFSPNHGLCILIPGALFPGTEVDPVCGWPCLSTVSPIQGVAIFWSRATLHYEPLPESWIRNAPPSLSPPPSPPAELWSQEVGHTPDHLSRLLLCFIFWLPCMPYGILVPQPGITLAPTALKLQSLNHWTTREVIFPISIHILSSHSPLFTFPLIILERTSFPLLSLAD